jgi:hypothetical protein
VRRRSREGFAKLAIMGDLSEQEPARLIDAANAHAGQL